MANLHIEPPIQHMGEIGHTQARDGFWGPRTASVDWCEPNYLWSPYIAEFHNTWTSLCIIFAGVFGLMNALKYKYHTRFIFPSFFMIFIGCGSVAFHGTLQYWGQALDELSMVYAVSCYLFVVLEMEDKIKRPWLPYAIAAYDAAFTAVYAVAPRYFDIFVCIFVGACVWVLVQSVRIYRVTYDVRLRRLFWVGFGIYGAAFFFMWIPDNLACEKVGWLHLHAWFHICSSIAPYWWVTWATHSFYTRRYAERTGLLRMADGTEIVAPTPLMETLSVQVLPESKASFDRSATKEMHTLAPRISAWAETKGVAPFQRRPSLVQEMLAAAGVSRPTSPRRTGRGAGGVDGVDGGQGQGQGGSSRRGSEGSRASDASDPATMQEGEEGVPGPIDARGRKRRVGPTVDQSDVTGGSGAGATPPPPPPNTPAIPLSQDETTTNPQPIPVVITDAPLPVPELHWYGPRSLMVLPYVHVEWREGHVQGARGTTAGVSKPKAT